MKQLMLGNEAVARGLYDKLAAELSSNNIFSEDD